MNTEDKELLLKDLCARLSYGVKYNYGEYDGCDYTMGKVSLTVVDDFPIENVKPYLFPLSSMTEEQKQEYTYIVNYISPDDTDNWKEGEFIYVEQFTQLMHFYHINHLDYRDMIGKGLAIDATGLNIY